MSTGGSEVRNWNYKPCLRGWCLSLRELKAPTGIIQRTTKNSSFNVLFYIWQGFISSDWPWTCCVTEGDFELLIFLPPSPKFWDSSHVPLYAAYVLLGIKPRASSVLAHTLPTQLHPQLLKGFDDTEFCIQVLPVSSGFCSVLCSYVLFLPVSIALVNTLFLLFFYHNSAYLENLISISLGQLLSQAWCHRSVIPTLLKR